MVEKLVAAVKKLVAAWSKISRAGWKIGQCMIEKLLAAFNFFNPKKRKLNGRRMVEKLVGAVKKLVAAWSKISRAGWKIGQCMIEKLLAAFNFFDPKKRKLHGRRMVKKLVAAVKKLVAAWSTISRASWKTGRCMFPK